MIKKLGSTILLAAALLLSACSSEKSDNDKVEVVATYSIIYDLVKNVGGDKVEIHSLVPIGSNPHEYDPLPEDVMKATDADAVFYNGLNLEEGNSWFEKLMKSADKSGEDAPVFRVSEGVEPIHLESKGLEKQMDPHAWLDIKNGIKYVENIRDALSEVDPENKEYYKKNADAYIKELNALHEKTITELEKIPKEKRILITSEGAFKYFGNAYNMDTGYIWEINSDSQGSPQQIKNVVDYIGQTKVPGLFVETSVDPRSMETVSKETGIPIKGKVFTDSLGKKGEDGDTYIEMMKWNTETIIKGLQ
ncbi:metal ABC transporter substrate-binding protein [Fictibacillus aquaticus]|uniref:Metal ABC transporter substrate-binding protein n=1 Tax=Fictibacillus aquaticus TaxID=2021314 RepID=A0A235F9T7_9BACL|nr:metal ABC transporter substrate-binding protein [Fictibacillus aquaticus]OYD57929.1 metal ABC transporter substrate-binding protein [Fictibacillus aquaticus]